MIPEESVTALLSRLNEGDRAVWERLIPVLYADLRRLAHQRLRFDRHQETLATTALVNECYLRLVQNAKVGAGRDEFLAVASQTMRRVLVDYARARKSLKRGGGRAVEPLDEDTAWLSDSEAEETLLLNTALDKLMALNERAGRLVELRFFGGLSIEETARVLGLSEKTARRDWVAARAWLRKEISSGGA